MSHTRIDNVEDAFSEGDEVTFKIVAIDERTGKLRLSRKAIMPRTESAASSFGRGRRFALAVCSNSGKPRNQY